MFGNDVLYFESKIPADWIATVVNYIDDFEDVYHGVSVVDDDTHKTQSSAARELLLNRLSTVLPGDIQITKNLAGYPEIILNSEKTDIAASLAHDGRFVAYSFVLTPVNAC